MLTLIKLNHGIFCNKCWKAAYLPHEPAGVIKIFKGNQSIYQTNHLDSMEGSTIRTAVLERSHVEKTVGKVDFLLEL